MQKIEVGQVWSHPVTGSALAVTERLGGGDFSTRPLSNGCQPNWYEGIIQTYTFTRAGWTLSEPAVTVQPNMVFALRSDPESRWVVLEADQQPHGVTRVRNVSTGLVARVKNKDWGFTRAFKHTGTSHLATGEKEPLNVKCDSRRFFIGFAPGHTTVSVEVCKQVLLPSLQYENFYGTRYDFELCRQQPLSDGKTPVTVLYYGTNMDAVAVFPTGPGTELQVDGFFKDLKREGFPLFASVPTAGGAIQNASELRILLERLQSGRTREPLVVAGHFLCRGDRLLQALLKVSVAEFNRRMGGA